MSHRDPYRCCSCCWISVTFDLIIIIIRRRLVFNLISIVMIHCLPAFCRLVSSLVRFSGSISLSFVQIRTTKTDIRVAHLSFARQLIDITKSVFESFSENFSPGGTILSEMSTEDVDNEQNRTSFSLNFIQKTSKRFSSLCISEFLTPLISSLEFELNSSEDHSDSEVRRIVFDFQRRVSFAFLGVTFTKGIYRFLVDDDDRRSDDWKSNLFIG